VNPYTFPPFNKVLQPDSRLGLPFDALVRKIHENDLDKYFKIQWTEKVLSPRYREIFLNGHRVTTQWKVGCENLDCLNYSHSIYFDQLLNGDRINTEHFDVFGALMAQHGSKWREAYKALISQDSNCIEFNEGLGIKLPHWISLIEMGQEFDQYIPLDFLSFAPWCDVHPETPLSWHEKALSLIPHASINNDKRSDYING
jgi:hypothetical protein